MNPGAPHPVDPEFPEGASNPAGLTRKEFLRLMGASLALAGASACTRQPPEQIVPYVRQPEGLTPGDPLFFATAMEHGPNSYGLLVKSHDGRPIKIEGNPAHPMSLGRTSVHAQAAVLELYDPDRSQIVRHEGQPSTWEDFLGALQAERAKWAASGGAGIRLLIGGTNSPLLHAQIDEFLKLYPRAKCFQHDAAFTRAPRYDLENTDVIVSFDSDFLGVACGDPRDSALFAERRTAGAARLYVFESMPSLTGAMADHRFALHPGQMRQACWQLLEAVDNPSAKVPEYLRAIVRDLEKQRDRSLILVGLHQPKAMHAAAEAYNARRAGQSKLVSSFPSYRGLDELAGEIRDGQVAALIILGCNPIYTAPGDLSFTSLPSNIFTLHSGLHVDETAKVCRWHIPQTHFLESWSDTVALNDAYTIVQPLIEPLYPAKSPHEILAALTGRPRAVYEIVRETWKDSEANWRATLHDGVLARRPGASFEYAAKVTGQEPPASSDNFAVLIRPDPHLLDGRCANNAWLQELPKPITGLTWDNAIHLSPATAAQYSLAHGDEVELASQGRTMRGPVWILPGHADHCATLHLGGGRTGAGRVGNRVGYRAALLQSASSPWLCEDVQLRRTGGKHVFATTQHQHDMAGREPVRVLAKGAALARSEEKLDTLYPEVKYTSPSWGMVIDLNTCTGCGTCTIACQAENNIPVVGRAEVMRGRAMHWIRVDQYIEGKERPQFLHQPVPCMHCENAPCELVCPVAATVHDHQGLNLMVYNRCIGTRYCSNNCPYKVRRFNFFQYVDQRTPQLKLQRNPEVTVRERGVMEKCTYCLQRISAARITADVEKRAIRDGEIVPACAQACPANAIAFGDIFDSSSKVAAARRDPRNYALLEELNTRPRTTYLAKVTNLNPEMTA